MKRLITLTLACIILFTVQARAQINYNLLYNWQYQPPNVQGNLVNQWTNIQVVDNLDWQSPDLYDTYAYTRMNVVNISTPYVINIDMRIKKGYEETLTHEVGHCISNANHYPYWWAYRPEFIQIWEQEKNNCVLLIGQGQTDIREYFATAYDLYIRFPKILKKCCPMTYNYITVVLQYTY